VLVGAGKMGGAMLEGWLALGLDPEKIAIRSRSPRRDRGAAARGVRINPASVATRA
jgi:pyrroline-5-carboxylate reductase